MNRAGKLCRKLPVLVFGSLNCRGHEENSREGSSGIEWRG